MKFSQSVAEKYLKEVGYTSNFIYLLKNNTPSTLPLPKIINVAYKKEFISKQQEIAVSDTDSVVVAVAEFIFEFLLDRYKDKNLFSDVSRFRVLPICVLPTLYKKREKSIADLLLRLKPFSINEVTHKIGFSNTNNRKFSNFFSQGTAKLALNSKVEKDVVKTILKIPVLGSKFAKTKQVFLAPEFGTSVKITSNNMILIVEYRMNFSQQFSFDGVKNPKKWIEDDIASFL